MRNLLTIFTLSIATLLASAAASAQDGAPEAAGTFAEPSIVNPTWAFDLEIAKPNAIAVPGPSGRLQWYWYIAYKVTNNTNEDRLFIPEVVVLNNHGEIVQANRRIPPAAYPAIADRLGNTLLESPNDVVGRLLQGQDFAKESVAIWPASYQDVDEFTVFFGGVDGETKMLRSPRTGEPIMEPSTDPITGEAITDADGNAVMRPIMVRRTRALTYQTPGTTGLSANLREQPVQLIAEFEVMR